MAEKDIEWIKKILENIEEDYKKRIAEQTERANNHAERLRKIEMTYVTRADVEKCSKNRVAVAAIIVALVVGLLPYLAHIPVG